MAVLPKGKHDDQMDSTAQLLDWCKTPMPDWRIYEHTRRMAVEINPYAAELARVTVWIGEIQWMRRNGFSVSRDPILKPLETIECRDAVLNEVGTEANWPTADVVVGNPPFLGDKGMLGTLGKEYVTKIRTP